MSSLKRILSLAKQTGGPVVIYDAETGTDFVLQSGVMYDLQDSAWESENDFAEVSLSEYSFDNTCCAVDCACREGAYTEEDLYVPSKNQGVLNFTNTESTEEPYWEFDRQAVIGEMNSAELLAQINRDIASWKSYQDTESEVERAYALEEELIVADEESIQTDWHTPASIFEHYTSAIEANKEALIRTDRGVDSLQTPEQFKGMIPEPKTNLKWEESESTWSDFEPITTTNIEKEVTGEIHLEPVPFDAPMVEETGEKESLIDSEAPVFYSEPIL